MYPRRRRIEDVFFWETCCSGQRDLEEPDDAAYTRGRSAKEQWQGVSYQAVSILGPIRRRGQPPPGPGIEPRPAPDHDALQHERRPLLAAAEGEGDLARGPVPRVGRGGEARAGEREDGEGVRGGDGEGGGRGGAGGAGVAYVGDSVSGGQGKGKGPSGRGGACFTGCFHGVLR